MEGRLQTPRMLTCFLLILSQTDGSELSNWLTSSGPTGAFSVSGLAWRTRQGPSHRLWPQGGSAVSVSVSHPEKHKAPGKWLG